MTKQSRLNAPRPARLSRRERVGTRRTCERRRGASRRAEQPLRPPRGALQVGSGASAVTWIETGQERRRGEDVTPTRAQRPGAARRQVRRGARNDEGHRGEVPRWPTRCCNRVIDLGGRDLRIEAILRESETEGAHRRNRAHRGLVGPWSSLDDSGGTIAGLHPRDSRQWSAPPPTLRPRRARSRRARSRQARSRHVRRASSRADGVGDRCASEGEPRWVERGSAQGGPHTTYSMVRRT